MVVRTYLHMRSASALRPAGPPQEYASLTREAPCDPALYRQLYAAVGSAHHWRDRREWSTETLTAHLARPDVAVWVLRLDGAPAGFFELVRHGSGSVEIAYFGLAPGFLGRGLGKWLLTRAVQEAWALSATRVWLHTCTLDHPSALPNYKARGFMEYRVDLVGSA